MKRSQPTLGYDPGKEPPPLFSEPLYDIHDVRDAYESGAAVAFGIMGWAQAIKENGPRTVERHYWTDENGERLYTCFCPGCGSARADLSAGVHEGTDMEWCGVCRDSW